VRNQVARPLAILLLLAPLAAARADEQYLSGSKLVLTKKPVVEHLVLRTRDDVVAPLPASTEDPTLVGGALEIGNPGSGERAAFTTSAQNWTVNALGTVFRFRNDRETGPGSEVRAILIRHQRELKISTRALGITLDEQAQGALSVVLRTGTRRYCFLFGGKIGKDKPGRFVAHNAPAPSACLETIVAATTTTTSRPPGTRPTSTSVTSSTSVTNSTSSTSTTQSPIPSTSTTKPPTATTTTSTIRPTTSSTTQPPATTTSTSPAPSTTSSTAEPPPTTSTSSTTVASTSTTTSTVRPCGRRGNSCNGACPLGLTCAVVLDVCACF
jgi:hypothetical protein